MAVEQARTKPQPTSPINPETVTDSKLKHMIADAEIVYESIAPVMRNSGRNLMDGLKPFEQEKELRESNRHKKVSTFSICLIFKKYIYYLFTCFLIWELVFSKLTGEN